MQLNYKKLKSSQKPLDQKQHQTMKRPLADSMSINSSSKQNSCNISVAKYSFSIFILLFVFGSSFIPSLNAQDCVEDCGPNEYCRNG
jgi:hypothetical protein